MIASVGEHARVAADQRGVARRSKRVAVVLVWTLAAELPTSSRVAVLAVALNPQWHDDYPNERDQAHPASAERQVGYETKRSERGRK
ncbi:hypothetical protein [Micromonospora kangleipakensis]|uniref:hypothetical protein n=1 Tax=Micromonospora kangleipakensis TaxID=1077942 RepID=UPI001029DC3F|nr:hypothetical protein [Micromonospora kangleipakensis]